MARGYVEKIDKERKVITIKGKEYNIGKRTWNRENFDEKLEIGIEVEYEMKGNNFDFKKFLYNKKATGKQHNSTKKVSKKKDFSYPYNFVRVNSDVERKKITKGDLSGKIICTLTNRTPLFFPALDSDTQKNQHKKEEFCKDNNNYIISASSLKGSFRSVLEAMTNSCFVNIEKERLDKREMLSGIEYKMGIIEKIPSDNEDGVISEAKVVKIRTTLIKGDPGIYEKKISKEIKRTEVIENQNTYDKLLKNKECDVFLWIGSKINKRKYNKIIYKNEDGKRYSLSKDEYEDILYIIQERKKRDENFYITDLKVGIPILFQEEKGKAIKLSISEIPRLRLKYSPYDLLPDQLKPCKTYNEACYACRLFGMIGDKTGDEKDDIAFKGRVFFKDATIPKGDADIQQNPVLINSLGKPHPTFTKFYLEENGNYNTKQYGIRGRKFYWHHKDKIDRKFSEYKETITPVENEEEKHNSSIQFMNCGNKFEFEVVFKELQEEELGALLLTLELEKGMLHKFGKAKSLGFGSSEVKIEKLLLESDNRYDSFDGFYQESSDKGRYIEIFKTNFKLETRDQWKDLKIIMSEKNNLDFSKSPFPEEGEGTKRDSLKWFIKNKNIELPRIEEYKL